MPGQPGKKEGLHFMFRHTKGTVILVLLSFFLLLFLSRSTLQSADVDSAFSFSPESGFYGEDVLIQLSLTSPRFSQAQIHYTLDGSTPDASSPLYESPLSYPARDTVEAVTVKAVVCDHNSRVIGGPYTATYFIRKNITAWSNALVVSITADDSELYSPENGILYPMSDCGPTAEDWKWFEQQNCKQRGEDWIRKAHMDLFEPDGKKVISQDIGLCVDGDHGSMTHYPYSLKVLAGKEYDPDHPSFQYDIFHYYNTNGTLFPHVQEFNNLVFRNGGNEYNAGSKDPEQKGTMLRWNVGSRLADEAGFFAAGARPAMVFLNGEFYSVAQLQDSYNRHNIGAKTILNKDDIELYKDAEKACTEAAGYADLYYSYPAIQASPILRSENQSALEQIVSLDDMFSYYAFQVLVNNTDFPKKNYAIWRYTGEDQDSPFSDGKYRFLINDLDCTYDFRPDDDLWTAYFNKIKEDGVLMGSLVQVDSYKANFVNSLCDLMNSGLFDREHLGAVIDEANNDFSLAASYYYTPQDEAQRQRNVALLKETAFARKDKVQEFIQDTFSPTCPYTLSIKEPEAGASICFSTTRITARDGDFQGTYYGDYPLTLSADCASSITFSCWKINGETYETPKVTLDTSYIRNGQISVELVTQASDASNGLVISEVYAGDDQAWVELCNISSKSLNLSQYALSNDIPAHFLRFHLPEKELAPGEVFVVGVDNAGAFRLGQGISVYLTRDDSLQDSVSIPIMAAQESYGRLGETDQWRYYIHPTPGELN